MEIVAPWGQRIPYNEQYYKPKIEKERITFTFPHYLLDENGRYSPLVIGVDRPPDGKVLRQLRNPYDYL